MGGVRTTGGGTGHRGTVCNGDILVPEGDGWVVEANVEEIALGRASDMHERELDL